AGKRDQAAFRCEAEDLILEKLELGVLEELFGIVALQERIDQMPQPLVWARLLRLGDGLRPIERPVEEFLRRLRDERRIYDVVLVERVGRNAMFRDAVHASCAHLQLDALVTRADDRRVDRLVAV